MIINAKATRQEAKEQAATQPYRFTEEPKNSRWPWAFVVFLGGITLYIKSMFPGWGGAEAGTRPEERPDEDVPLRSVPRAAVPVREAATQSVADEAPAGKAEPDAGFVAGSDGRLFDFGDSASFATMISLEFDLMNYASFGPFSKEPFNFAGAFMPANDNPAPGPGPGAPDPGGNGPRGSDIAGNSEGNKPNKPDDDEPDDEDEGQPNRAPRVNGPVYLADIGGCAIALIGLSDLLANAVDLDGDTLSISSITVSSGTLTQAQGGWLFDAGGYGPVAITYQISDGALSVMQTAYFNVVRNSIEGTSGDDLIVGTQCADDIEGGDGNDNIDARGGDDIVLGGAGNDHIVAGTGNDIVHAGPGNDIVFGGDGDDWISGGLGDDRLFGEAGRDTLFGDDGNDHLSGGEGNDLLFGGAGDDVLMGDGGDDRLLGGDGDDKLSGGEGNDVLMGEAGDDLLMGDSGNDTLSGGDGEDEVIAGDGDDTVIGDLDAAADSYDGGAGTDTIDYSAATTSISFNLATGTVTGVEVGEDTISNFEIFVGGSGNDHFFANGKGGTFRGGAGDDIFEFAALSNAGQRVVYEILDFMAGDRIKVSRYEIFEEVMDSLEHRFEEVYGNAVDDDDLAILISHEYTGNLRRTLIEADLDNDDHYELAITITGSTQITVTETV